MFNIYLKGLSNLSKLRFLFWGASPRQIQVDVCVLLLCS